MLDGADCHDAGDVMKFENSARFFINGDLGENATWHGDINLIYDTEGVNGSAGDGRWDFRGYEPYTQNDWLRELYIDTNLAGWLIRVGKQQLVWGTADGIKLLDIINPTDYRELNQNTMEDARIPIWMAVAEKDFANNTNFQVVVSQVEENKIPGLSEDGDEGQPFIMQGVDAITGDVNGFLNIAPALANVAASFTGATQAPAFPDGMGGFVPNPLYSPAGLVPFSGFTVDAFAGSPSMLPFGNTEGYQDLNLLAQYGFSDPTSGYLDPNGNFYVTNLMPTVNGTPDPTDTKWDVADAESAFDHMANATFATFNTFNSFDPTANGGMGGFTGATSSYRRDYPDDWDVNAGFRFKQSLDNGFNYSLNYFYHYSANPDIDMSWHDAVTGEELTVQRAPAGDFVDMGTGMPGQDGMPDFADFTQSLSPDEVPTDLTTSPFATTTVLLHNDAGQYYGAFDPTGGFVPGAHNTNPVDLRFTESLHRVHSLGAAFDYALDTDFAPVVLRGEFLYDHNDAQPVVDKKLLAIGDLTNALKMEDADYFKYVLGVDVTVMTNLLISGQFIQYINLDYENSKQSCVTQTGVRFDCSRYTGDFPTMSVDNSLKRGYEYKEFFSLFFSKPFGESQRGRWNNITIWEEGGGFWNRFDVEYSFSDTLVGTAEWNQYWGNRNTTFGQFEDSSSIQVGLKYIFD